MPHHFHNIQKKSGFQSHCICRHRGHPWLGKNKSCTGSINMGRYEKRRSQFARPSESLQSNLLRFLALHLSLRLALSHDQHRAPRASSLGLGLEGGLGATEGVDHLHTLHDSSGGVELRRRGDHRQECRAEADGPRQIAANPSLCYPRQPRGVRRRSFGMQESAGAHMVSIRHLIESGVQSQLGIWPSAGSGRSSDASALAESDWAGPSVACSVALQKTTLCVMCHQR